MEKEEEKVEINYKTDIYERLRALFHTDPTKDHTIHVGEQLRTKEEQNKFLNDHHITAHNAFSRRVLFPLLTKLHEKKEGEKVVADKLIDYLYVVGCFDDHADTPEEMVQKRIETWKQLLNQYVKLSDKEEIDVFTKNVHLIEDDDTLFNAYSTVQMMDVIIQRVAVDLTQAVLFASQ
jgi:hypothetical protein